MKHRETRIMILALVLLVVGRAEAGTDPVQVDPTTGANFNRYAYANNNPYRYVDPDGRAARIVHAKDGSVTVQLPTQFTGAGATPGNIRTVRPDSSNKAAPTGSMASPPR